MAEEIDLNDDEEAALDRAWAKLEGAKTPAPEQPKAPPPESKP